jgi:hypothetical protein
MILEGSRSDLSLSTAATDKNGEPPPPGRNGYLSPALARRFGGPPAFEMKFQIEPARAEAVGRWARERLSLDPYADPERGGYRVHTLYFDTPAGNLFRRVPGHYHHKFRIRRYGGEQVVYLERKTRVGDRVMKRRTRVACEYLDRLVEPNGDATWAGHWYWRRLRLRELRPACRLSYDRCAFVASGAQGAIRLTLDRQVGCLPSDGLMPGEMSGARPVLNSSVILELKYRAAMPAIFKTLLVDMALVPRATSKYRLSVAAMADLPSGGEMDGPHKRALNYPAESSPGGDPHFKGEQR